MAAHEIARLCLEAAAVERNPEHPRTTAAAALVKTLVIADLALADFAIVRPDHDHEPFTRHLVRGQGLRFARTQVFEQRRRLHRH